MRQRWGLSWFIIFSLSLAACTAAHESAGEYIDSTAITAKVKTRLIDHLGTRGLGIKVNTYKDEVQLSGFVGNAMTKRHAGIVAAQTAGVRGVRNDLVVK